MFGRLTTNVNESHRMLITSCEIFSLVENEIEICCYRLTVKILLVSLNQLYNKGYRIERERVRVEGVEWPSDRKS